MAAEVGWPAQCDWDRPYSLRQSERLFADLRQSSGDRFIRRLTDVDSMGAMKTMEGFLDDYNMFSVPMPLVMFADACEHVARVCRLLRQPSGNAVLAGN